MTFVKMLSIKVAQYEIILMGFFRIISCLLSIIILVVKRRVPPPHITVLDLHLMCLMSLIQVSEMAIILDRVLKIFNMIKVGIKTFTF